MKFPDSASGIDLAAYDRVRDPVFGGWTDLLG
jgi:hypothetical protein